jgi:hypothetical protein
MATSEMQQWWSGLGDNQAQWLHAYQNGPNKQLANSLPADHRPNATDEWVGLGGFEDDPGNADYFFATEFREFLGEQYERSVGGTAP